MPTFSILKQCTVLKFNRAQILKFKVQEIIVILHTEIRYPIWLPVTVKVDHAVTNKHSHAKSDASIHDHFRSFYFSF